MIGRKAGAIIRCFLLKVRGTRLNGGYGEADVNAMDTFDARFHGFRMRRNPDGRTPEPRMARIRSQRSAERWN
ncbi:hypothetical protein [Paenibacillus ihbetae]|uniref:hypothetical protein n=1 Tax=Paenibacillus ihbetae TaxID=1870820 RepID=UPI000F73BF47|nr:hypothetical protein [Paenibacillus ihbetae]